MKSLAFLKHSNDGGKFRTKPFIPFLRKEGIRVDEIEIPRSPLSRLKVYWALKDYDVVVIEKKMLNVLDLSLVRRQAKKIIYDFDDAIMYRSSRHRNQDSPHRMNRFRAMIKSADAVIAGNSYLAEHAAHFISPDRVFVIPTIVDVAEYGIKDYTKDSTEFIVGWIGSASTIHYLAAIIPAIKAASKRVKNLKLKIVCNRFFNARGLTVVKKPWRAQDVESDLMTFDVGVMPIPDDPWTRGKCGFKLIQYLAAGVPAIASPTGINRDIVIPGKTGFWAENLGDWENYIVELAENGKVRKTMGQAGRRHVEERFSLQTVSRRYIEILERIERMHNGSVVPARALSLLCTAPLYLSWLT